MTQPARGEHARSNAPMARVLTENSDLPALSAMKGENAEVRRIANRMPAEMFTEDVFRRILWWERKRAERSGKCVLLMLVDAEKVLLETRSSNVFSGIVSAVSSPTRETDMLGWYKRNAVFGLLFTQLHKSDAARLQKVMTAEVIGRLRGNLGHPHADGVIISFHLFPQDWENQNGIRSTDEETHEDSREATITTKVSRMAKRAIDILVSLASIIILSPLFFLIAVAIKLTSEGPILFRQERVGQHGRRFTFLKFRSMKCGSDPHIHKDYVRRFISGEIREERGTPYKLTADPRLTPIGGFLRKCSLDELPQLINVLKGEMSLVGPRPAIPYEIDFYKVWHRNRFLSVKPGITGLWQVMGRSRTTFDDMVRLDIRYAKQWSLWLDIKILLHTPRAVLSGEGAY